MRRQCKYAELVAVYRGLDIATRLSVDEHLRKCQACAARLAGYERVDESLRTLQVLDLPARLQQSWSRQLPDWQAVPPDRRFRNGFGFVVGRVLLPASLIIGLVAGVWFLLATWTGDDNHVAATPTLTLTPTATVAALLDEDDDAEASARLNAAVLPQAVADLPVPLPTLIATQIGPSVALRSP